MCLAGVLAFPLILLAAAILRSQGIGFFRVGPTSAAGPRSWVAHAVALVVLYLVPALFFGIAAAAEKPIASQVGEVMKGMPAEAAGLRAGDRIVAVNGAPVRHFAQIREHLIQGKPNAITLERGPIELTPDAKGLIGIMPDRSVRIEPTAGEVIWVAIAGPPRVWKQSLRVLAKSLEEQPVTLITAGSESTGWWVMLMAIHFAYAWVLAAIAVAVNALLVALRSSGTRTAAA